MRHTLSISLSPALKKEIDQLVQSGMYRSASELIRTAVRELSYKKVIKELKVSQNEARAGRLFKLSSLVELRK